MRVEEVIAQRNAMYPRSYTRSQLADITGVPELRIRNWISSGFVPKAGSRLPGGNYTDLHVRRIRDLLLVCKDGRVTMRDFAERHEVHA